MLRQLTIALSLVTALMLVSSRAPAQSCAMTMPAAQKMACTGCCATMKSCVLPQKNPSNPATTAPANQPTLTMVAPATTVLLHQLFAAPRPFVRLGTQLPVQSSPRLALLCTFLI